MKISLLFLLILQACSPLYKQGDKKILKAYAYSRAILPGVSPSVVIHENGTLREKTAEANQQYFIYTEVTGSSDVVVKYVWLNRKRHDVVSTVTAAPVIIDNSNGNIKHHDTLVSKTPHKVLQIEIKKDNTAKATDQLSKSVNSGGMIIEYFSKGKTRYYPVDTIRQLAPLILQ